MKNKYAANQSKSIERLEDDLKDQSVAKAVQGTTTGGQGSAPAPENRANESRTLQTPDFEGDAVPNFTKRAADLNTVPIADFEAGRTFHATNNVVSFSLDSTHKLNQHVP